MMKVLVTGANGFLGSWLTRRLMQEGHTVSALVRKNSDLSEISVVKPFCVYGDVTDLDSLKTNFKNQDVIFHLAGLVAYAKKDRSLMDQVNVHGTANVIEACAELKVPQLLYVSSVVAVGALSANATKSQALTETFTYNLHPLNLGYFETKKMAEDLVIDAVKEKKIQVLNI